MGILDNRFYQTLSQTSTNSTFEATAESWIDEAWQELVSKYHTYTRQKVVAIAQGSNELDRSDIIPTNIDTTNEETVDRIFSVEFQPGTSGTITKVTDDAGDAYFESVAHPLTITDYVQIYMDELDSTSDYYTSNYFSKRGIVYAPATDEFKVRIGGISGAEIAWSANGAQTGVWVKSDASNVNRRRVSTKTTWEDAQAVLTDPVNPGAAIPAGTLFVTWVMVPPLLSSSAFAALDDVPDSMFPKQFLSLVADWAVVKALQSVDDQRQAAILETRIAPRMAKLEEWANTNVPVPVQEEGYFKDSAGVHGFRSTDTHALTIIPFANSAYEQTIYDRFFRNILLSGTKSMFDFNGIKTKIDESFRNLAQEFGTYKRTKAIVVDDAQSDFSLAEIIPTYATVSTGVTNEQVFDVRNVSFIQNTSYDIAVTDSAGTALFTTTEAHGLSVGDEIRIFNTEDTLNGDLFYDGYTTVATVPLTTTFTTGAAYSSAKSGVVVKTTTGLYQQNLQKRGWEDVQMMESNPMSRTSGWQIPGTLLIDWCMTPSTLNNWTSSDVPSEVFPYQYRGLIADKAALELLMAQDEKAAQRLAFSVEANFKSFNAYANSLAVPPMTRFGHNTGMYAWQLREDRAMYVSLTPYGYSR